MPEIPIPEFNRPIENAAPPQREIEFPNGEAALEAYLRKYEGETERAEKIKDFLYEFLRQEIQNITVFKSEKYGAELPYTSIKIAELAKSAYQKYRGNLPAELAASSQAPIKQQYVIGSAIATAEGNEFTFVEEAMSQCVKYLPTALKELQEGNEPEEREIITLGMPTNTLGSITPELGEKLATAPYDEMGKIYAELVNYKAQSEQGKPKIIELYGVSLGSNIAIRTGEQLVEQGAGTQDFEVAKKQNLPYLEIRAEVPVSLSQSKIKKLQIPVGFLLDAAHESRLPEIKRIEAGKPPFATAVAKILADRGITEQMSDEQKKIKNKVLRNIIMKLGNKFEPKPETKITSIYGLKDLTTYTPSMVKEAETQGKEFGGTLGQNLLERQRPNVRSFTAEMPHLSPRFPDNELKRMRVLGIALEDLKQGKKS